MKKLHSILRAEQRYYIMGFNPNRALKEILSNRCLFLKEDSDSKIFLIRYENKYIKVVTDYNLQFVKTVLPQISDLSIINSLIKKINTQAA